MIEVVVEHGDQRRVERIFLLERMRPLHLQRRFGYAIGENDVRRIGFIGLRGPVVTQGNAVGLHRQVPGNLRGFPVRRLQGSGTYGYPASTRRFD